MNTACPDLKCLSSATIRVGFSAPRICLNERRRQRYKCLKCKRKFSENSHLLSFRLKHRDPALNAKIFSLCVGGFSNRAIARFYYVSEGCVRGRLRRLSQQALNFHHEHLRELRIREAICFDGLQNFAGSQYDVNNIQQAIGRDSLFIYDFNFASMNRSGRMSPWQKNRLRAIESACGRYNPQAIRIATRDIVKRLHSMKAPGQDFNLLTDEHFQYRRAVNHDLKNLDIRHVTISGKACRNFQNILFTVNHADLMIRQRLGAFARETISFSKNAGAMCQKYALFLVHKNYMIPQFTKKHVRRPDAHRRSPAQDLGITERLLDFSDVFHRRSAETDTNSMNDDWQNFWLGTVPKKYRRPRQP